MRCRPVDYDLIDALERRRRAAELSYTCPFWPHLLDLKHMFISQGWWLDSMKFGGRFCVVKDEGQRGVVYTQIGQLKHVDACAGEIPWR